MRNLRLTQKILELIARRGVHEIILCAGRRNAPLITALEERGEFRVHSFFEERSAAFFALGRAKATGRPVAICTTSGTACAELLPAFVEAHYSGAPLIAITADRPRRLRGTGAPQTIEQPGIFGCYVRETIDLQPGEEIPLTRLSAEGSLHINLAFDEPLLEKGDLPPFAPREEWKPPAPASPSAAHAAEFGEFLKTHRAPLVIVGALRDDEVDGTATLLHHLGAPAYLEATSRLRGSPSLASLELRGGASSVARLVRDGSFDSVIRCGGVPTLRLWRDFDESLSSLPLLSISSNGFPGLATAPCLPISPGALLPVIATLREEGASWHGAQEAISERDHIDAQRLAALLKAEPASEPGMVFRLAHEIPEEAALYLGNSLPIREWDLAAPYSRWWRAVESNRGANGIDGQLSTFFGWNLELPEAWAIVGDLTALYDLAAPWACRGGGKQRIVVINNGGGQIFKRMFASPLFRNEHHLSFAGWAEMWEFEYVRCRGAEAFPDKLADRVIIEVTPDEEATDRFWREYENGIARRA